MERLTKTRQAVEHLLQTGGRPLTMMEIYQTINQRQPIAFSTVFRVIRRLEQTNLIDRVDWRERSSRFEWINNRHHHHIVCQKCRRIHDVDDAFLPIDFTKIEQASQFQIQDHTIELVGLCASCQ